MSRKDRQRRRQREAEWKQAIRARPRDVVPAALSSDAPLASDEPAVAVLSDFEITWEPMSDRYSRLVKLDEQRRAELFDLVHSNPRQAVLQLKPLIEESPNVPMLYNWLAMALAGSGRDDEADEVIELNYRRNPDYLFAKCNYAELCLRRGESDKVPEIFNNQFFLTGMYPDRKRFHITEFTSFMAIMVLYFQRTGEQQTAKRYFKMLEDVAPDEPQTQQVRNILHMSPVRRVLDRLTSWAKQRSKHKPTEDDIPPCL